MISFDETSKKRANSSSIDEVLRNKTKKQNGKKKEQGTYPENIEDPRVLQPSRDYTNFGYNPDTKPKASNEGSS